MIVYMYVCMYACMHVCINTIVTIVSIATKYIWNRLIKYSMKLVFLKRCLHLQHLVPLLFGIFLGFSPPAR